MNNLVGVGNIVCACNLAYFGSMVQLSYYYFFFLFFPLFLHALERMWTRGLHENDMYGMVFTGFGYVEFLFLLQVG